MTPLLDDINNPQDIKKLSIEQLPTLAEEIRRTIIDTISKTGGHLASSLGTVDLTLALYFVFDPGVDQIVWDVGHQAYSHKILTGRKDTFSTIRKLGGISGFPKIEENRYDNFGTGHSSTSISAALGISTARCLLGECGRVIAVIGDGSMTGGQAFEALNQAGHLQKNVIVVLNDNEMSIDPNVGALSSFLSRKLSTKTILRMKKEIEIFLRSFPMIGEEMVKIAKRAEDAIKGFFTPGMLFEAMNFQYFGPIDGHRIDQLVETFNNIRSIDAPIVVHVLTKKGKGYRPAEKYPTRFHGIGQFDVATGKPVNSGSTIPTYTRVFSKTLLKLAAKNDKIVAITAAMAEGTGLSSFANKYPDRFYDVGIAEQHAVTFAAGLATQGFIPVIAIYSTFLQRAYDQVLHDVSLQNLPVIIAIDRGGIVGEDGPTHHGIFDIAYLRCVPNLTLMAPKDENELARMLATAVEMRRPAAIRYPRGRGTGVKLDTNPRPLPVGRAEVIREGDDITIIALGSMVAPAVEASERLSNMGIESTLINARFVKPLDVDTILHHAFRTGTVLTVEEGILSGGFGSAVIEEIMRSDASGITVKSLGIPDRFVEHGPQEILRDTYDLSARGITKAALGMVAARAARINENVDIKG
ncbi:MAG: 1-deoxy-D-xylulose-5-phosphate synthase [Deltaproteobacteria bacterium]|nr:1-deoxy-D-xylulose-5-phosphate synthase [Candidatus Zymogenaceae bacterium]